MMRFLFLRHARRLLAAAAFVVAAAQSLSPARSAEPGSGYAVLSYAVVVRPDMARQSLSVTETVRVESRRDGLDVLTFSPNSMEVTEAAVDGQPVAVSGSRAARRFHLPRPLALGEVAMLAVRFTGNGGEGVTFTGSSVYTGYWACGWMMCVQDAPGQKAPVEVVIEVPRGMGTLSVGSLVEVTDVDDHVAHRWRTDRPYSAYLMAFAAGEITTVDASGGVAIAALGSALAEKSVASDTDTLATMVDFFASKAGMPLPGGRYTQLVVPGSAAQEAATYSVIGADEAAGVDQALDWAAAHELSHQWWGNLVTCRTWRDMWLNEGLAVFMTAAWKEHRYGRDAYDAELAIHRRRVEKATGMGWNRPVDYAGRFPSLPVRRAIQYSRGALLLDHLRSVVGDDAFWTAIREYTRAHAGGAVETADFIESMERASGRELSDALRGWIADPPV